jgi:hypothetical protein
MALLVIRSPREYDQAMSIRSRSLQPLLFLGDALVFLVVTVIGFASHGTLQVDSIGRFLATLLPFYVSWLLFAYWSGLLHQPTNDEARWWLRCGIAAALSAPLAAMLRAFWLGSVVLPTFVLIMAAVSALAVAAWRWFYQGVILPRGTG